jgi:16S rRNA (cytosine967-C5)-methyltransferase
MAAVNLLEAVLNGKQALDSALERDPVFGSLEQRDRAFCRMLVSTTLRRLGQIDDLISKAEERPGTKHQTLQNILRLGVAQIMFMNVPDHAAVDTSVRLAEGAGLERQKGFVNGLLRTITRVGKEWVSRQDEGRLNTPEWLLKTWIDDHGLRAAAQIAKANLSEAPLDITLKDPATKNYWAGQLKASELATGSLRRISGGAVHELPGFAEGAWWVQDAAAAIPARLFGDVQGKTVVDLCAAPGGKTIQLAAMGANVIALDRSAQRLKRLEQNIKRLNFEDKVKAVVEDASVWKPMEAPQFILLDAPCTATGTIRRNPDVPYLKSQADEGRMVSLQASILQNAFRILAPGGILIYCTCSLQKSEGEDQVQALLESEPSAIKLAIKPEEIGGIDEPVTEEGDLRILPFHQAASGGMDGFFISRITKAK